MGQGFDIDTQLETPGSLEQIQALKELPSQSCALFSFDTKLIEQIPVPDREAKNESDVLKKLKTLLPNGASTRIQECLTELFKKLTKLRRRFFVQVYTDAEDIVNREELRQVYLNFQRDCGGSFVHVILVNESEQSKCAPDLKDIFPVKDVKNASEFRKAIKDASRNYKALGNALTLVELNKSELTTTEVKAFQEMVKKNRNQDKRHENPVRKNCC